MDGSVPDVGPKDAGALDGGPPDAGEPDAGQPDAGPNLPPEARPGLAQRGIPWDTKIVDGTGSRDPNGDALTFSWRLVSAPAGSAAGFAPFPGTATASGARAELFADLAGTYELRLEVSDGELVDTATTTVEIVPFTRVPAPPALPEEEVRAMAVRAPDATVFLGVKAIGTQIFDATQNRSVGVACQTNDKVNAIEIMGDGAALFAFDDDLNLTLIRNGQCEGVDIAGDHSKVKDILRLPNGQIFAATDKDVYSFMPGQAAVEHVFDAVGNDGKYKSLAVDATGGLWIATEEAEPNDGVILTSLPPDPSDPVLSFLPGDDKVKDVAAGLDSPPEIWVATDVGVVRIPDVSQPGSYETFTVADGTMPGDLNDKARAVAFDPSSRDVWIATQVGLARFKRDIGRLVSIPVGASGIPEGDDIKTLAIDRQRGRIYVGSRSGGFHVP